MKSDAFCDKICSKIRESQFCVVLLNDPILKGRDGQPRNTSGSIRAPSANVYYEFGMAKALEKPVIPVIRSDLKLPFDVQHLDTIIYYDLSELRKKLKDSILPMLTKSKKEFRSINSKEVKHIYGLLYDEISHFLSKPDRFTTFNPSQYQGILVNYRHKFDIIDKNLQEEIETFYNQLKEFNSLVQSAERIIPEIVTEQLIHFPNLPCERPNMLCVELKADSSTTTPTIAQILIRKTTPENYFKSQGILNPIRRITYKIKCLNTYPEIDKDKFLEIFKKCQTKVENNTQVAKMRKTRTDLEIIGKDLKKKLIALC